MHLMEQDVQVLEKTWFYHDTVVLFVLFASEFFMNIFLF